MATDEEGYACERLGRIVCGTCVRVTDAHGDGCWTSRYEFRVVRPMGSYPSDICQSAGKDEELVSPSTQWILEWQSQQP